MKPVKRQSHHLAFLKMSRSVIRGHHYTMVLCLLIVVAFTSWYLSSPTPSQAQATPSADIVISQIYGGNGNTYKSDFVELYNRGNTTVTFTNWSIQYRNTGTTWQVTSISGTLAPGQYYLVKEQTSATGGADLPTADATGSIDLSAINGRVALVTNNTAISSTVTCPQTDATVTTSVRDFVGYGNATCFEGTAAAPAGTSTTAVIRKLSGSQDTNDNSADFTTGTPTPHNSSSFAINYDNSAQGCNFDGTASPRTLSWSHTIGGGTTRALFVGVSTFVSVLPVGGLPPPRVSGVTYNGTPMTRLDDLLTLSSDGTNAVEMFVLKEPLPVAGTYTVQVTLNPGVNYVVGGSVSFNGVNQTTPTRVFTRNSGTSTTPTVTVASATGDVVLDTVSTTFSGAILTANASQTERWNGKVASCFGGLNSIGAGSTKAGATSTTMSWTQSGGSQPWAIGAVSIVPLAPTEVKLSSFTASQTNGGVRLNWETGYEVDNLGYNVYREDNGQRVLLNPSLIAGSAFIAGTPLTAGFSYHWFDPQGTADSLYYLEDIDLNGTHTMHGPITPVASSSGTSKAGQQAMLLTELSSNINLGGSGITVQGGPALFSKSQSSAVTNRMIVSEDAPPNPIASIPAVKLAVNHSGWYRADLSQIAAAGLNPATNPRMLQLYADGMEQPLNVNSSSARLDGGGYIEFYGMGLDTPSTDTRTYWLLAGSVPGKRIIVNDQTQPDSVLRSNNNVSTLRTAPARPAGTIYVPFITILPDPPKAEKLKPEVEKRATEPSEEGRTESAPAPAEEKPKVDEKPKAQESVVSKSVETPALLSTPPVTAEPVLKSKAKTSRKRKKGRSHFRSNGTARLKNHADTGSAVPQSFAYTVERKERTLYISSLLNGDDNNFFGQILSTSPVQETLSVHLLDTASTAQAQLDVVLQGVTAQDHRVLVQLNGTDVGTLHFVGQANSATSLTIDPTLLHEGDNTVKLITQAGSADVNLVDRLRLTYAHLYRAENDALNFTSNNTGAVNIEGFSSSKIRVLDITDPTNVQEIIPQVTAQGTSYMVTVQPDPNHPNAPRNLLAFASNQYEHPSAVTFNFPSYWSQNNHSVDFLIITNHLFHTSVKPLALARRNQGLSVGIADVEDIFDEFSYGAHSPQAIKDFLSWASTHWQHAPQFVLLVGDGSYDPRDYQGKGQFDLVPTKMVDTRYMETADDDWYADFDNDGIPKMAVGRLPVRTIQEADTVISKLINYHPSSNGVLLISDKIGPDGYNFESNSNDLKPLIPNIVGVQSIVRHDEDSNTLKAQIISSLNQGPLIANYAGHGTYNKWTGDGVLSTTDASSLANSGKASLFVTMTCMNGYYVDTTTDSLAEALLKTENGGAIAVWASSGITLPTGQAEINQRLYQQLFGEQSLTLGEAIQKAKAATTDMDVRRTWIFFGDPTMRLR